MNSPLEYEIFCFKNFWDVKFCQIDLGNVEFLGSKISPHAPNMLNNKRGVCPVALQTVKKLINTCFDTANTLFLG